MINFRRLNLLKEFYVPELDAMKVKADRALLGTNNEITRYIARVGYKYEPMLMSDIDVSQEEDELLKKLFRDSIIKLNLPVDEEDKLAKNFLGQFHSLNYPPPTYHARGELAFRKRKEEGEETEWRRMWFLDFKDYPHQEKRVFIPRETVRRITGKYYPPSGGYDPYYGDSDYEPGGIYPAFHQTLFIGDIYLKYFGGWDIDLHNVLVHPNDMIPWEGELTFYGRK